MRNLQCKPLLRPELLFIGGESDVDGMIAFAVDDHQVAGFVAIEIDEPDQPRVARGVRNMLGLAQHAGRRLIDKDQLVRTQQGQVVPTVLVDVADGEPPGF